MCPLMVMPGVVLRRVCGGVHPLYQTETTLVMTAIIYARLRVQ